MVPYRPYNIHLLMEMPQHQHHCASIQCRGCSTPKRGQEAKCYFWRRYFSSPALNCWKEPDTKPCQIQMTSARQREEVVDKSTAQTESYTETNAVEGGKKKSDIYFSFSVQCEGVCRSLHDKEWWWLRLMACLQCDTKSAQMLCAEKMPLLTSIVSFLSTGETPSPYSSPNTPTELYHTDENLTPLNLIKVFQLLPAQKLSSHLLDCPVIPRANHKMVSSAVLRGYLDILSNCGVTS